MTGPTFDARLKQNTSCRPLAAAPADSSPGPSPSLRVAAVILIAVALSVLSGCQSPPQRTRWRTVDEGTFTFEVPHWLHKSRERPVSPWHSGAYDSKWMVVAFEETDRLRYPAKEARAEHDALARASGSSPGSGRESGFIQRSGDRYLRFGWGLNSIMADANHPLKYAGVLEAPNPEGGFLGLQIFYGDDVSQKVVLRIARSLRFKR